MTTALIIALSSCGSLSAVKHSVETHAIRRYGEYGNVVCARLGARRFEIDAQHRLLMNGQYQVTLPTDALPYIQRVHLLSVEADLLIVGYDIADEDALASRIVAVDLSAKRTLWSDRVPRGNLGPMIEQDSHLYVSATGFIAALNARTGALLWVAAEGWDGVDVEAFDRPVVQGNALIYREWTPYDRAAREFRVDKRDGRRLNVHHR